MQAFTAKHVDAAGRACDLAGWKVCRKLIILLADFWLFPLLVRESSVIAGAAVGRVARAVFDGQGRASAGRPALGAAPDVVGRGRASGGGVVSAAAACLAGAAGVGVVGALP